MKMKSTLIVVGGLLSSSHVLANPAMPSICNTAINYAVQTLDIGVSDGSFSDAYDPGSILLTRDFNKFPITKVKFLGNCDDDSAHLKRSWCAVGGGSPDVFQAEVSQADRQASFPVATVIVTANRGGCRVDRVDKK